MVVPPVPPIIRITLNATRWASMNHLTWIDISELIGGEHVVQWDSPYELRKLTASWTRAVGVTPPQDAAMCTFHFLNITSAAPDATWTTTDYTTVESAFDTFWAAIKTYFYQDIKLTELKWRADGPAFRPHGSTLSPTLRTVTRAVAGGNTTAAALPPQVSLTVTEVTAAKYTATDVEGVGDQLRNRWGRFYLPPCTSDQVSSGRPGSTMLEAIATAAAAMYQTCKNADLIPVMYSPTTGSSWSVDELHVDDLFDVVRSRRYRTALARHAKVIT